MRSLVALMTCIGCIAWIHSCEKRLLGVRIEKNNIPRYDQPQQLPVASLPHNLPPHYISGVVGNAVTSVAYVSHNRAKRPKKQTSRKAEPSLLNLAWAKNPYTIYNTYP
ncbi:MAG: hypothetical protein J7623_24825 [Chitinophaga sp.]|uniref:hypothetical protein n=1 Tax=Chitinophaga sp. TaxID=1869181 RepID=UPI001B19AC8F|nr:hypothetical protein [Chitinophaga sp.]MBO9731889.1 hypothetical protein [Chitinophaga sp.]